MKSYLGRPSTNAKDFRIHFLFENKNQFSMDKDRVSPQWNHKKHKSTVIPKLKDKRKKWINPVLTVLRYSKNHSAEKLWNWKLFQ